MSTQIEQIKFKALMNDYLKSLNSANKSTEDLNKHTNDVNKSTENLGSKGKMSMINLYAGIQLAVQGFKTISNAVGRFIDASNKQETELKKTNFLFGDQADSVIALSVEMQKLTKYGDEEVLQLANLAKSMGATDKNMEQVIKGSIGLSEALGIDLNSAVKMVTTGVEGQDYTLLNRYLPTLRLAKTESEKTAIFQNALANGFDLAKESAKTGAGAIAQFQNKLGDLYEVIGDVIKKGITPFAKGLTSLLSKVMGSGGQIQAFETLAMKSEFLAGKTKRTAFEQEQYVKVIQQLKREYPEHLKNINTETTSQQELSKALKSQRDLMIQKMALDKKQEALSESADKQEEARNRILEIELKLANAVKTRATSELGMIGSLGQRKILEANLLTAKQDLNDAEQEGIDITEKYQNALKKYLELGGESTTTTNENTKAKNENAVATDKQNDALETQKIDIQALSDMITEWASKPKEEKFIGPINDPDNEKAKAEENKATWDDYANYAVDIGQSIAQIQLNTINSQYNDEKKALDEKYKKQLISKEKYDVELKKLDDKRAKDEKAAKIQQKAWAITESVINTWVAASKLLAQPWLMAAVIASGVAQTAKIATQEFTQGGIPEDVLSNNSSENVVLTDLRTGRSIGTMSSTEGIINNRSMSDPTLRSIASAVNVAGGGRAFSNVTDISGMSQGSNVTVTPVYRIENTFDYNGVETRITELQSDKLRDGDKIWD